MARARAQMSPPHPHRTKSSAKSMRGRPDAAPGRSWQAAQRSKRQRCRGAGMTGGCRPAWSPTCAHADTLTPMGIAPRGGCHPIKLTAHPARGRPKQHTAGGPKNTGQADHTRLVWPTPLLLSSCCPAGCLWSGRRAAAAPAAAPMPRPSQPTRQCALEAVGRCRRPAQHAPRAQRLLCKSLSEQVGRLGAGGGCPLRMPAGRQHRNPALPPV